MVRVNCKIFFLKKKISIRDVMSIAIVKAWMVIVVEQLNQPVLASLELLCKVD